MPAHTFLHTLPPIRQLYQPLQPAWRQASGHVVYSERLPADPLRPFVYCYWELRSEAPLDTAYIYPIVADGCVDLLLHAGDPSQSFVMGFSNCCTPVPLGQSFHYAGIRFFPSVFPAVSGIDARELSGRFERLESVVRPLAMSMERALPAQGSFQAMADTFDQCLISYLSSRPAPVIDRRAAQAVYLILQHRGGVQVQTALDIGLSPRQLRRYFEQYVGGTPKSFSQVVRFQHILRAQPSEQPLREHPVFFDLGYYDQAHFIKEFKRFYGSTPGKVFGS